MYDCQKHKGGIIKTLQQIFINKLNKMCMSHLIIGTKTKLAKMLQGGGGVSGGW